MPIIADATNDEPPAKCCKYCEESTHSVDGGPASWRLTLDQDLIDTLKGNFPSWFQTSSGAAAAAAAANKAQSAHQLQQQQQRQQQKLVSSSIIPISIDTKSANSSNNTLQQHQHQHQQQQQQQQQLQQQQTAILSSCSSSASPASSISSNSSKKSNSSCSSSSISSVSSCSSNSSNSSTKSVSATTVHRLLNKSASSSSTSTSPSKTLSRTLKATQKTHNNSPKVGQLVKSASLHSLSSGSGSSASGSGSGSSSGSSLLATISTSPLTTVELISSANCNGLLATRLSGKALEHTFQDIILLHEAYDDMSEGEHRLHATFLGSSDDGNNSDCYDARQSPPKAIVDSSPLQPAMDKNKESLKVKLMVRRPHSQLVEQGIIPSLKTSPAIHEQCKQLERAKTSDLLKAKIQQRPNREDLERLHILEEDECHIDPSLAEKQRMLKKARLADQLNSQIQHRPGPLELIKKNILHTEKPIEKIVKEGLVPFKATSEGLLTRPQHPHSYVTYDEDSQSSESDTRQTPPRLDELMPSTVVTASNSSGVLVPTAVAAATSVESPKDVLQAAAASAGIVTVALTTPTSTPSNCGQLVLSVMPSIQLLNNTDCPMNATHIVSAPPPPPPPMPMAVSGNVVASGGIKVKQETANLFEELCQSVAGPTASPSQLSNHMLPMLASPCSLASSTSTLSPLSSIASPPPPTRLQLQPVSIKSDAPGKDKNRKKSKSKPVSKARTIKFHEYKGPPSAAGQTQDQAQADQTTSYQLLLEQQNYLLKFLENLNKNQSILPANANASTASSVSSSTTNSITVTTKTVPALASTVTTAAAATPTVAPITLPNTISISSNNATPLSFGDATLLTATALPTATVAATPPTLSLIAHTPQPAATVAVVPQQQQQQQQLQQQQQPQQHPPPLPSPALSVSSSIPASPATSYAESTSSAITDLTRLEKMKVSDLKQHLKRRNLPVSGPKPQLIERLKLYLPLEPLDAPATPAAVQGEIITISDAMDTSNCGTTDAQTQQPAPVAMLVSEEHEQMDVVQQQLDSNHAITLQTIMQPQPQTATIIQNEELLRRQQRKIDELQRQLQRSQQELQQIRRQQQQQTVTAQVVNALPSQQITLITTTSNGPQQTLTVLPQLEKSIPAKVTVKPATAATATAKLNGSSNSSNQAKKPASSSNNNHSSHISNSSNQPPPINQKMVVKQQLEAKIQKQKAAAAAAALQQQQQQQQQAQQQQQQQQMRLLTQKTQTVLIPSNNNTISAPKLPATPTKQPNVVAAGNTTTILHTAKPLTATTTTAVPHPNNVGLVWNEGNQTIFLLGLNDQQVTAHTLGNISLTATTTTTAATAPQQQQQQQSATATPVTKKLLNGHQRTNSLPSIVFPIDAKPIITQQQLLQLQQQQQQQPQQHFQPGQQLIQLDIKPSPAPPPQYEEATKQLAASKAAAALGSMPLMKIKEEPTASPAPAAAAPPLQRKSTGIKSEQVSDVLDILIKQGELPESAALEPITPLTPLPELAMFNGVTPTTAAGGASIVPLVPKLEAPPTPQSLPNLDIAMDTNESSHVSYATSNQAAAAHGFIESIDMSSPLQPDTGAIDAESVAKTLDIFLEQHHATPPPSTPPKCNSVSLSIGDKPNSPDAKLNHFDEYELLELMSQQLEMDIGDDSNNYCSSSKTVTNNSNNNLRRDLNPSLQPSINELLDASSPDSVLLNNNHGADVDFDADSFVAQLSQHVASSSSNNSNSSNANNNSSNTNNGIVGSPSTNSVECVSSNGHYNSTPMDVCDDFESTLNSIMQAVSQPPTGGHSDYSSTAANMTNGVGVGVGNAMDSSSSSNGGAVDAFNVAGGDIFDLFNIDDYKMMWAAGDFPV